MSLALIVQCDLCGTIQQAEEYTNGMIVFARSARKAAAVRGWTCDDRSDVCVSCRAWIWAQHLGRSPSNVSQVRATLAGNLAVP